MKPFKFLFHLVVCICLIFSATINAQSLFTGKVTYNITINKTDNDIEVTTNGSQILLHMKVPDGNFVDIISDRYSKQQVMVTHKEKSYMNLTVYTVEKLTNMMRHSGKIVAAPIISETRTTGESKKILGIMCEKLIQEDGNGTVVIWAAKTLGSLAFNGVPFIPVPTLMNSDAASYFPLEMIATNPKGDEIFVMKTKEVNPVSIDKSAFALPTDYILVEYPMPKDSK